MESLAVRLVQKVIEQCWIRFGDRVLRISKAAFSKCELNKFEFQLILQSV